MASHCVRAGATGSGSGADWTNAYTDLPVTLTRGDVYYIAVGSYAARVFNDAVSGTLVIEIRAATVADHGTATGWSDAFVGQAVFTAALDFTTPYWILNGVYRGTDWRSGYGFKVNNNNGANHPTNATGAVLIEASNVTVKYVEAQGSHDTTGTDTDVGIRASIGNGSSPMSGVYIGSNWVHDVGGVIVVADFSDGTIIEYNWCVNGQSTAVNHAEGFAIRVTTTNITIRYNYIENADGTAFIADPSGGSDFTYSNWAIYGNIMFRNGSEEIKTTGTGDGAITLFNFLTFTGFLYIYNNTFANMNPANASDIQLNILNKAVTVAEARIKNNLWYNCPTNASSATPFGTWTIWDYDDNAYFDTPNTNDTSPTKQSASGNPFVDVSTASSGHNNFHLALATQAGASLASPYTADLDGTLRGGDGVWDRGAFEFGTAPAPAAVPSLTRRSSGGRVIRHRGSRWR